MQPLAGISVGTKMRVIPTNGNDMIPSISTAFPPTAICIFLTIILEVGHALLAFVAVVFRCTRALIRHGVADGSLIAIPNTFSVIAAFLALPVVTMVKFPIAISAFAAVIALFAVASAVAQVAGETPKLPVCTSVSRRTDVVLQDAFPSSTKGEAVTITVTVAILGTLLERDRLVAGSRYIVP